MNPIANTASQLSTATNIADAYGVNSQQTEAGKSSDKVTLSQSQSTRTPSSKETVKDESVSLSPRAQRAQKIESMAKDFFSSGNFSTQDIPKLVQRLYQDGILSDSQLTRLSDGGFDIPQPTTKPEDLKTFIKEQRRELENALAKKGGESEFGAESMFIKLLNDAESVIDGMGSAQSAEISQKASRVSAQLNVYLKGDVELTQSSREQWQGLKSVMQLAASMGENQQAGGQLSSYLALGKA
ncbi:conserved hypothetical protein [Shewanella sediminis HAW-EB3]|uniref:Uncharacterized protein n=1 Tax=Shewanella sediminis (strain HAW-EB3) TaxID=425104 RepID=A8FTN7_SHESH|nr:hypothetical protein [Shewanella sediminis]ABV36210.1 conserved hypothetical protein [Shewanella sediminis HAW-EB3]